MKNTLQLLSTLLLYTHTHFVTVIKRTQPTVDHRQAGTDQNDSSGHNYKIVMEARRLSER